MGKSGSTTTTKAAVSPDVQRAQAGQIDASLPVLQEFASQMMEALRTGGNTSQIPMMQRAVEAGQHSAAVANQSVSDKLARSGVTGPYARATEAGVGQQGDFVTGQIAPQIIQSMLSMVPDFAFMRGSPVFGGASSTGSTSNTTQQKDALDVISSLFQMGASAYGASCWIALELYGAGPEFMQAWSWVNWGWKGRVANAVRAVYGRYGKWFAERVVRRSAVVRAILRPLFDVAVRKGASCQ